MVLPARPSVTATEKSKANTVDPGLLPGETPLDPKDVWGSGDRATWTWIALMCAFGLCLAVFAYLLPEGRDASLPLIRPY